MTVLATRRSVQDGDPYAAVRSTGFLTDVLSLSDFVVVTAPLTEGTVRLDEGACNPDNVARGAVVDEEALYTALRERRIAGAALDVWYSYPTAPCQPLSISVSRIGQRSKDASCFRCDRRSA